jgi:hypothetical protein
MGGEGGRGSRGREILVEAHPVQILAEILDRIEAAQSTTARRTPTAHHPFHVADLVEALRPWPRPAASPMALCRCPPTPLNSGLEPPPLPTAAPAGQAPPSLRGQWRPGEGGEGGNLAADIS